MINSVPQQPHGIRMRVPILGQQQPQQPPQMTEEQQKQMAQMQIMQAVNAMASGMYVQLAVSHITSTSRDWEIGNGIDVVHLRQLANVCLIAAKAFFEGIGVVPVADQISDKT